jgi:hypothetical protein
LIARSKLRCCAALDLFIFSVDPVHWVLASHAWCAQARARRYCCVLCKVLGLLQLTAPSGV